MLHAENPDLQSHRRTPNKGSKLVGQVVDKNCNKRRNYGAAAWGATGGISPVSTQAVLSEGFPSFTELKCHYCLLDPPYLRVCCIISVYSTDKMYIQLTQVSNNHNSNGNDICNYWHAILCSQHIVHFGIKVSVYIIKERGRGQESRRD